MNVTKLHSGNGWDRPENANKYHFMKDGKSLCTNHEVSYEVVGYDDVKDSLKCQCCRIEYEHIEIENANAQEDYDVWKTANAVIDYWVTVDYEGDSDVAYSEMGDHNALYHRVALALPNLQINEGDPIEQIAHKVDLYLY